MSDPEDGWRGGSHSPGRVLQLPRVASQWKNAVLSLATVQLKLVPQLVRMRSPFPYVVSLPVTSILLAGFVICTGGSEAPRGLWLQQCLLIDAEVNREALLGWVP